MGNGCRNPVNEDSDFVCHRNGVPAVKAVGVWRSEEASGPPVVLGSVRVLEEGRSHLSLC